MVTQAEMELESELEYMLGPGDATPRPGRVIDMPPMYICGGRPVETLDRFAFNSWALQPFHAVQITRIVNRINAIRRARPGVMITLCVHGHGDRVGPETGNVWVSQQRANTVLAAILARTGRAGITPSPQGLGAAQLTGRGPQFDRRVEVFISAASPPPPPPPPPPPRPPVDDPRCLNNCEAAFNRCLATTRFPPQCLARRGTCFMGCRR
jgi:hypothetical protein